MLGHRGDRQRGIDARVGRHRRTITDQEVLVAEQPASGIDHAAGCVPADHDAAENVRGRRDVGPGLEHHALCIAARVRGEPLGGPVAGLDEGRVGLLRVLLRGERNPAEQATLRPERDRVVQRLHHQEDHRATGPSDRPERLQEGHRMPDDVAEPHQWTGQAAALTGQQRVQQRHRVAVLAVGDELDVRIGLRVDARADRDVIPGPRLPLR